ncbi:MAG: hypothetical protein ACYTG7_24720 [Planctomycetota bacterium]|jgi:hypothetical protein
MSGLIRYLKPILATALESFRETRGWTLPAALTLGALLLGLVGRSLPASLHGDATLAGAVCYGGLCLIMAVVSMAMGSQAMAQDRRSGFIGVLRSKPLSGFAYFLGRFFGLGARITLLYAIPVVLGGLILQAVTPETSYAIARGAHSFRTGTEERDPELPVMIRSGGPPASWRFSMEDAGATVRAGLRFLFRPRYLRSEAFESDLPVRVVVTQEGTTLLDEELTIRNRKSLELFFTPNGSNDLVVSMEVTGGRNALELSAGGCRLIRDETGPMIALPLAALSTLPVFYLCLALALFFSTFVSIPTAFFACAVLSLFVLYSPSLRMEIRLAFTPGSPFPGYVQAHTPSLEFDPPPEQQALPGEGGSRTTFLAAAADWVLDILPDPHAGGGLDPLTRIEKPGFSDIAAPWREAALHLAAVLVLGCFLAGRREK